MQNKNIETPDRQYGEYANEVNTSLKNEYTKCQTIAGIRNVRWSEHNAISALGGLVYFSNFLSETGLFEEWVKECPLNYESNNAPKKRDVLGTILLSILSGHNRYAHMARLREATVDADLLHLDEIPSEDSVSRAIMRIAQDENSQKWIEESFRALETGVLENPWIMDLDVTLKVIYGKQEGATIGYNPKKPGRPSHNYHSIWVAKLRLCLGVEIRPGHEHASKYGLDFVKHWFSQHERSAYPEFVRGDIGYGVDSWMSALEELGVNYLFKLKQTSKVKDLIQYLEQRDEWVLAIRNWECCEGKVQLSGWLGARRVVIYRRKHNNRTTDCKVESECKLLLPPKGSDSNEFIIVNEDSGPSYEYCVYVLNHPMDKKVVGSSYNDRGDNENAYDELKNQWGWAGFSVENLQKSQLMAQIVALIYNWWSVFTKFVDQKVAREAITSRPMLLLHTASMSIHQSVKRITIHCGHSLKESIVEKLETAKILLSELSNRTAPQLNNNGIWPCIIDHILMNHQTIGARKPDKPPGETLQLTS